MAAFATRLKMLRERVGMTQQELADAIGLSISTVGMYESGARMPSRESVEIMADYFNVDSDYLLGRSDYTTLIVPGDVAAGYYMDDEVKLIANAVSKDSDLMALMRSAYWATQQGVKLATDMLDEMRRKEERDDYDGIDEIRNQDDD